MNKVNLEKFPIKHRKRENKKRSLKKGEEKYIQSNK